MGRKAAEVDPADEVAPVRARVTVLLAEDERSVRQLVTRVLERSGYRVFAASDSDEALAVAAEHLGAVDLLLTDVIMPGGDGKELHEALEARRPGLPVLFMSGYSRDVIARHGVLEEGLHFLPKPFTTADLLRSVAAALGDDG